mmetsp:Transcript_25074/g.76147  ORF Transcript_25074/g.76147 Transcript_25074/m.76147 type:complete len:169 (+) Transcript_25074:463-969(+)
MSSGPVCPHIGSVVCHRHHGVASVHPSAAFSGWSHAWHFDEAEYTVTLCLQQAESGGEFRFTPPLRSSSSDLAIPAVTAVLRAHGEGHFSEPSVADLANFPESHISEFQPGTLQIFGGRYCLHRVEPVHGGRDRLVAVLCFASEPGVVNSRAVQEMFWGRSVAVPDVN